MRNAVLVVLLLCACTPMTGPAVLRIATDATFPPFHFLDEQNRPTGFDLQLAQAAAERAGFAVELVVLPYDELFTGLVDGTHDVVAATTGITPTRSQQYSFSAPYFQTCQAVVVRSDDHALNALADLTDRSIGAEGAGTSFSAMQTLAAADHVRLDDGEGRRYLEQGRIDAWVVDEYAAVRAAAEAGDRLRVLAEAAATESYGFVFAKGADRLKAAFDQSLEALVIDGSVAALEQRFGLRRGPTWPVRCR